VEAREGTHTHTHTHTHLDDIFVAKGVPDAVRGKDESKVHPCAHLPANELRVRRHPVVLTRVCVCAWVRERERERERKRERESERARE